MSGIVCGMSGFRELGFFPRELLVAGHDDIAIGGIEFHEKSVSARLLRGDERTATAAKEIQYVFALA